MPRPPATPTNASARDEVLRAAAELVAERGPVGFTLREAARRAGVSHAAPGYFFGDLQGLFTALAVEGYGRFAAGMEAAARKGGAPLDQLLAIGTAYVDFALREPSTFRLMIGDEHVDPTDPALVAARARADRPLRDGLATLHGLDPDAALDHPAFVVRARLAWACVHGTARLVLDGPFRERSAAATRRSAASVIEALGPALAEPLG